MKKLFVTSLLVILSIPAIAADAGLASRPVPTLSVGPSAMDTEINTNITPQTGTSPFASATTTAEAWQIFESETQKILDEAKGKLKRSEYKKLSELRDELLGDKPGAAELDKKAKKEKAKKDKKNKKDKKDKKDKDSKNDTEEDASKVVTQRKLSKEEQEKKISELRDNATAMKEKEQSLANRTLGAAAIGATGIGGMQLASAISEQQADTDAEQTMKAYLATFTCNYADGKYFKGGEKDIQLPGSAELIALYSEYVTLANDLKTRKNALGIKPGIESETILEGATTGLYDDVNLGKTSGAYASLARALQNPDGEDAKMWAAQKEETAKKLKTGAITAGVGAVGGLIGNIAINARAPKERSAEINAKYEKLKKEIVIIQKKINRLPKPKCEDFNATGVWEDCKCNEANHIFSNGRCVDCGEGFKAIGKECVPKECELIGDVIGTAYDCQCHPDAEPQGNDCVCKLSGMKKENSCECVDNATKNAQNVCKCNDGYEESNNQCVPKAQCQLSATLADIEQCQCVENANDYDNDSICECTDGYEESDGKCIQIVAEDPKPIVINVPADTFFNSGDDKISDINKQKLIADIINTIKEQAPDEDAATLLSSSCITITGYADRSGAHLTGEKSNQRLSERRAQTVANILKQNANNELQDGVNLRVSGRGHTDCTKERYPTSTDYAKCRRVDISINSGTCNGSTPDSGQTLQNAIDAVASVVSRPQS